MRKTIAISSAVIAVMLMSGCSSETNESPTPTETSASVPAESATPAPETESAPAVDPSAEPTLVGEEAASASADMIEAGKLATQVIADGLSEEDAIALIEGEGYDVRVISRDDEMFPVTMDYRENRFNLKVENDKVTEVTFG